ncbi:MAG: lysophospholipase [Candidatus Obscuribacterales bacterium]|nr:lysophospholipase [Candidatus Obscuribacterales bacterium]
MLEWKSETPSKVFVVCIHGLGLCAKAYQALALELSHIGVEGYAVNVRGFGPDRNKAEFTKLNCLETVKDLSVLLRNIRREHPDYRIILIGESMGATLAIRIARESPDLIDGLVCSAPAWKLLKMRQTAVKGIFEMFLVPENEPGPASRSLIKQTSEDIDLQEHLLVDPSHKLRLTLSEAKAFLSFISKTDDDAKSVKTPVIILQGLKDQLVSPRAVAKIYKDIAASEKTFLIDGQGEHLLLEEGRFSGVLVEKLNDWIKNDSLSHRGPEIEVIHNEALTAKERQKLSDLVRLASTRDKQK